jgi:hypothetical protein
VSKLVRRRFGISHIAYLAFAFAIVASASKVLTAGYSTGPTKTRVAIDGVDYGPFDIVEGIGPAFNKPGESSDLPSYQRVTLKRDFVTDPSLYLWAKNVMRERSELKDITLTTVDAEGRTKVRYELKFCQPLAWTVEAANPAFGGYHERVDLAVQKIEIF